MSEGNRDYVGEALKRVSSSPAAVTSTARFNGGDDPALGDNTAPQQPAWKIGSFSAKELQKMEFPPLSWIVPDIIPAEGRDDVVLKAEVRHQCRHALALAA